MPTEKDVLARLSTVMDPELNVSLVQAGMVKSVRVDGGRVSATIELTTPACPMKGKIQAGRRGGAEVGPGVTGLDLTWVPRCAVSRRAPACSPG
jgi:ATP-binding protein involved in chromosome partitioning